MTANPEPCHSCGAKAAQCSMRLCCSNLNCFMFNVTVTPEEWNRRSPSPHAALERAVIKAAKKIVCEKCSVQMDYPVAREIKCYACYGLRSALAALAAFGYWIGP